MEERFSILLPMNRFYWILYQKSFVILKVEFQAKENHTSQRILSRDLGVKVKI